MKKYSKFAISAKSNKKFITDYGYKEGVFKTPQGKYVARVLKGKRNNLTTISQHDTKEEAIKAYNEFYNNLK